MTDHDPSSARKLAGALNDPARLAALARADLLDTPAEGAFDRLTNIATTLLGVPVSLVSIVDADRQFFKSAKGLPEPWASRRGTPLSHSFCQHVVTSSEPLVVEDARTNPLVRDNLAVDDLGVAAYAGFPILSDEGAVLGSLCAIDHQPRQWSERELDVLRELAAIAHTELALRAALRAAERAAAERSAVIESSTDGVYTVDASGRCTLANSAAVAMLGYSLPEMIGRDMHVLVHHHHGDGRPFPQEECLLRHTFKDGQAVRLDDTTLWRRDGTSFPAECTSTPLVIGGRLEGSAVTFRDITERIVAAEALRESEMRFRAVFADAGIGIVITDLEGRLLECNDAYERLTGYAREALLSTTFVDVTHPDDAVEQRRLAEQMLRGEIEQLRMDKRYIRRDGETVWGRLTATLMRDDANEPRFIVGAVEDVTLQRQTAQALTLLAEAGAVLASSLDLERTVGRAVRLALPQLGDACIVELRRLEWSHEAICVHRDPAREDELCTRRQRVTALPSAYLAYLADLEAGAETAMDVRLDPVPEFLGALDLHQAIRVPLRGRESALGVLIFARAHGRYGDGDIRLVEELARRITSAIENAALYREAQSATRARDEVLAVVSHDLRNPVHTIMMSASFLLELGVPDGGPMPTQLGVIRRSAERADRLIRDLLDVTRVENGKMQLDRRVASVAELLADAAQLVAAPAERRKITIEVRPPEPGLVVSADVDRTLQALDNLLGNAIKFTPEGGAVSVEATRTAAGIRFAVRDSGPGITPEQQANLFRRFWQARRADRRGVGLGLTIVKGIVEAHGGQIQVESDGRSGTTFMFTIPEPASTAGDGPGAAADAADALEATS